MSQAIAQGWNFTTSYKTDTSLSVEVTNLQDEERTLLLAGAVVRGEALRATPSVGQVQVEGLATATFTITLPQPLKEFSRSASLRLYFKSAPAL